MNTQNNPHNTHTNSTNSMANLSQFNQAISLTKPSQPRSTEQGNDSSDSPVDLTNSMESKESHNKVKTLNPSILADTTNQQFTDLQSPLSIPDKSDSNTLSDLSTSNDTVKVKSPENNDSEDNNNPTNIKKGKKAKLATAKSENSKLETLESEQVIISFPISPREKKQIDAVATLSGYDTIEEFIAKIVSQGMKPYLEAVNQALNKDKDKA